MGDAVLTSPLVARPPRRPTRRATIDVLASPSNREVFDANPTSIASASPRGTGSSASPAAGRSARRSGTSAGRSGAGLRPRDRRPRRHPLGARPDARRHPPPPRLDDGRRRIPAHRRRRLGARSARGPARGLALPRPARDRDARARARISVPASRRRPGPRRAEAPRGLAGPGLATARRRRRPRRCRAASIGEGREALVAGSPSDEPDSLHAGRFGEDAPLLAIHLGAGTAAKRWPSGTGRA